MTQSGIPTPPSSSAGRSPLLEMQDIQISFGGVPALRNANLSGAQLGESIFFLADLGGANLSGANLNHAVLRSANMGNTNQTGTNFTGAMMPDNTIHP